MYLSRVFLMALALMGSQAALAAQISLFSIGRDLDLSALADEKRDIAIAGIKELLVSGPQEKQASLLFRLAELYFEKSRFAYNKEYQKFDAAFQAFVDKGRKEQEPEIRNFTAESERLKTLSLLTYDQLLAKFPSYPRMDEVYYSLGAVLLDSGDKKGAAQRFSNLVREFPESAFVQDAYLGLGEYYFDAREVPKASLAYQRAYEFGLKSKKTSSYVYALYKWAWCDFNEQRFNESLSKLKQVVTMSDEAALRQESQKHFFKDSVQLRMEALNDTVRAYARLGKVDEAIAYFDKTTDQKSADDLIEKMGAALLSNGIYEEALLTYEALLKRPHAPEKTVGWHSQRILALKELDDREQLLAESEKAAQECQSKGADEADPCMIIETRIRELATHFHQHATKRKNKDDLESAARLYRIYARTFDKTKEQTRMQFYLAEVEWELSNFREAAIAYHRVRELSPQGEYFEKSLMDEIVAWGKLIPERGKGDLNEAEKGWMAAADEMVNAEVIKRLSSENQLKAPEIFFKAAMIWLEHDAFRQAESRFAQVIAKWPKSLVAAKSVEILLDWHEAKKDWPALLILATKLKENAQLLADRKLADRVSQYEEAAAFNQVMDAYAKGDTASWEQIALSFRAFTSKYPNSDKIALAHFNAGLAFSQASKWKEVVQESEATLSVAKDPSIRSAAMLMQADVLEKVAAYQKASEAYFKFAMEFPKDAKGADALQKAATLRAVTGNLAGAIAAYDKLNRENFRIETAKLQEAMGKSAEATATLKKGNLSSSLRAQALLSQISAKHGQEKEFAQACVRVQSIFSKSPDADKDLTESSEAAAFCAFEMLREKAQAYRKLSTKVATSQLKSRIEQKRRAMEDLVNRYLEIPQYNNAEWGLAAMIEAGDVLNEFVRSLREIPAPKGLSEEGIEIFRAEIEEAVFPVQERALSLVEEATSKSLELGIYSAYLKKGMTILGRSKSKENPHGVTPVYFSLGQPVNEMNGQHKEKLLLEKSALYAALYVDPDDARLRLKLADLLMRESSFAEADWILDGLIESGSLDPNLFNLKGLIKLKTATPVVALPFFEKATQSKEVALDAMLNVASLSLSYNDEARSKRTLEKIASQKEAT